MSQQLRVEKIESAAEFGKLREEWNGLLADSASNGFFLTWEWLHTCWRHLADVRRLFIVTLRRGDRLEAIAPFALRSPRWSRLLPFRALEFLGPGIVGSAYLDLIVRLGREEEAIGALAEYLSRERVVLDLAQLRGGASQARRLAARLSDRGWNELKEKIEICPFVDLSGRSWPSYLAALGSEHRYNFHRKLRKMTGQFELRFEGTDSEEERKENLSILIALHRMRWSRRAGGSGAFHLPALCAFHEELSRLALEKGWLRLFVLRLDGKPAAGVYGFRYSDVFYFYQSGFDPDYARYSVGLVAMGLAIKSAIDEGAREYDLLHGDEDYKFHWARRARTLERLELFPSDGRGFLCRGTSAFRRASKKIAGRVFHQADIQPAGTEGRFDQNERSKTSRTG
jgi:CelD/BcsL family acetyltransferase involved in cellulose biosynthesis